jgi:hypothetical protein
MTQHKTSHKKLVQLRHRLDSLSKEELRNLCFDLGVKYDDLLGKAQLPRRVSWLTILSVTAASQTWSIIWLTRPACGDACEGDRPYSIQPWA